MSGLGERLTSPPLVVGRREVSICITETSVFAGGGRRVMTSFVGDKGCELDPEPRPASVYYFWFPGGCPSVTASRVSIAMYEDGSATAFSPLCCHHISGQLPGNALYAPPLESGTVCSNIRSGLYRCEGGQLGASFDRSARNHLIIQGEKSEIDQGPRLNCIRVSLSMDGLHKQPGTSVY